MKKTKGFTLIEMLLVMGIIIILIGVSVSVARFSIRRANKIFHMSAADNLKRALVEFKNENKYVPKVLDCNGSPPMCYQDEFFARALGYRTEPGVLNDYLEELPFDGGSDATYYYATDDMGQLFLVCVSFGGVDDEAELGYYCTGTGLGFIPEDDGIGPITKDIIEPLDTDPGGRVQRSSIDDSDWRKGEGFITD